MARLLTLLLLAALTASAPATAQTVRDSVRMSLDVADYINFYDLQGYPRVSCGATVVATWPNVLSDILGREGRYSDYSRVATGGMFVPGGREYVSDENYTVPAGHIGHNSGLFGGGDGPADLGDALENCNRHIAGVQWWLLGNWTFRNARPFRVTDWYAVFSVPDGTPIALFEWEQTQGTTVAFDARFEEGLSREVDATAPGGKRPVARYAWDFGDGQTGAGATPAHVYAEPGTYEVTLTVTDDDGDTDGHTETVTVEGALLRVTVTTETPEVTTGDTLSLVATVANVGTEAAYGVTAERLFTHLGTYPDWANVPGNQFKGVQLTPTELPNGESRTVERESLAPGASMEIRRAYVVEDTDGVRQGYSGPFDPVEAYMTSSLPLVSGQTAEGEPVRVEDGCADEDACEDVTTVVPNEPGLVVRSQIVTRRATVNDTLVVRAEVENTGTVALRDVVVPATFTFAFTYADSVDGDAVRPPILLLAGGEADTTLAALARGEVVQIDVRYVVDRLAEVDEEVAPDSVVVVTIEAEVSAELAGVGGVTDDVAAEAVAASVEPPATCAGETARRASGPPAAGDDEEPCVATLFVPALVVNDTEDSSDYDLEDGRCDVDADEDGDQCTLRAAIQEANVRGGATITFGIESSGLPVIDIFSALPALEAPITLDASSQPGGWVELIGPTSRGGGAIRSWTGSRSLPTETGRSFAASSSTAFTGRSSARCRARTDASSKATDWGPTGPGLRRWVRLHPSTSQAAAQSGNPVGRRT